MKNIIIAFFFLAFVPDAFSKPLMQATIKKGSAANMVDIYLKSSESFSKKDDAMTFVIAVPAASVSATSIGTPGAARNATGFVAGISGLQPDFVVNKLGTTDNEVVVSKETIRGNSYYVYTFIFAGTGSSSHTWVAGEEQKVFSVQFNGCTGDCDISGLLLTNLPRGGANGNSYWYFQANTLGDITNYKEPFYDNEESIVIGKGSNNGTDLVTMALRAADKSTVKMQPVATSVRIYPTLTKGLVNVQLPAGYEKASIKVLRSNGQQVSVDENKTFNRTLDLKGLANGTYIVQVLNDNRVMKAVKVIVQH